MFEKVNPYKKEELNEQAIAHLCGCRCASDTNTVSTVISKASASNTCDKSCIGQTNEQANYEAAYADRHWPVGI